MQYIVKAQKTYLKSPLTTSATSVILRELKDSKGNNLTLANFGTWGVIVIKQGETTEMIKFSGLSTAADDTVTLTVATNGRNLDAVSPYAGSSTGSAFQSGAECIVTNDPLTVMQFGNINNPQTWAALQTFSVAPISSVDASAASELVRKSQLDSAVLGSIILTPVVIPGNGGEVLAVDQLVYLKVADGEWYKCDADTAATVDNVLLGITRGAGTDGGAITNGITILGAHDASSALFTANTAYYASNTAGGFSSTPGTVEVSVGFAISTTRFYLYPRYNQQLTEDQQDALAGTSGTPSGSNKFVTEADTKYTHPILQNGTAIYAADAGSSDTYAVTLSPVPAGYVTGMVVHFKANTANTGAASLNVNGLGDITIKKKYNEDLITGDILANQIVSVVYDGTNFQVISPLSIGSTDVVLATASDTLKYSADTERSTDNDAYTLVKQITVRVGGTVRVTFDAKTASGSTGHARIYVNGTAVGTERTPNSGTYVSYSEDITVAPFDLVQLYYQEPSGDAGALIYVRNFRIKYDLSATSTSGVVNTD